MDEDGDLKATPTWVFCFRFIFLNIINFIKSGPRFVEMHLFIGLRKSELLFANSSVGGVWVQWLYSADDTIIY